MCSDYECVIIFLSPGTVSIKLIEVKMDLVVAVALGLLTVVVAAALIGLTFIIRYKFCGKNKEQDVEELVERPSPGLSHISEEIRLSELGICDDDVQRIVQSFQWEADIK